MCLKVHATFPKVPPTFTESSQTKLNEAKVCQDFEAKVWYRFEVVCLVVGISEELNPRVRCAFGNVLLIEAPIDIFQ